MHTSRFVLLCALLCTHLAPPIAADELTLGADADWMRWSRPGDAMSITQGRMQPTLIRRDIDAIADAAAFGGGILASGSNAASASRLTGLQFFRVLTSNGEGLFNTSGTIIPGTVRYGKSFRYSFNEEEEISIDFGLNPLRYIRVQADRETSGAALAELSVLSVGDNIALGLVERGGSVSILNEIGGAKEGYESSGKSLTLVDGDINSNWTYKGASAPGDTEFQLDLGAVFWSDRVRILGDLAGVVPSAIELARTRVLAINFPWYQLWGSDGTLAPDGSLRWTSLGDLPEDPRNWRDIVHFEERFELQRLRHLRLRFGSESCCLSGTTAEFQVFGEGHPAEVPTASPLYDLGGDRNITTLSWQADTPAGTRLEIRSRSGNELIEEFVYYDKNGKQVTQSRWERLIPSFRGRIDTLNSPGSGWSPWSRAYSESGQLQVTFSTDDPQQAASLAHMRLEFSEPLAASTRGEIHPVEIEPATSTLLTYYIRPQFAVGDRGFDQILLSSSAPFVFRGMRLDGMPEPVTVDPTDTGIRLSLDHTVQPGWPAGDRLREHGVRQSDPIRRLSAQQQSGGTRAAASGCR